MLIEADGHAEQGEGLEEPGEQPMPRIIWLMLCVAGGLFLASSFNLGGSASRGSQRRKPMTRQVERRPIPLPPSPAPPPEVDSRFAGEITDSYWRQLRVHEGACPDACPSHAACVLLDRVPGHGLRECQQACMSTRGCDALNLFEHEGAFDLPVCHLLHCGPLGDGSSTSTSWLPTNIGAAFVYRLRSCSETWNATRTCFARRCRLRHRDHPGGSACVLAAEEAVLPIPPRRIHVLSMGRVGSSYLIEKFEQAGVRIVFEPFATCVEGMRILTDLRAAERISSLYECGRPAVPLIQPRTPPLHPLATAPLLEQGARQAAELLCHERTIAIKTTRVTNLTAIATLPRPLLDSTRYVLLLRDPRGAWNSMRQWRGQWAVASIGYTCSALEQQLRTRPALSEVASVFTMWYERWSAAPHAALCELAWFVGFARMPTEWRAATVVGKDALSLGAWERDTPADEVRELESHPACSNYMAAAGYLASSTGHATDYSKLPSSDAAGASPTEELRAECPALPMPSKGDES